MKTHTLKMLAIVALLVGQPLRADEEITVNEADIKNLGPLPDEKSFDTVQKGERNPFAQRTLAARPGEEEDRESEESKLRRILQKMPITGLITEADGRLGLLLGRKLYHEGDQLRPVMAEQTALLRLSKLTKDTVEISWVESQADSVPRKVSRKIEVNQPYIKLVLPAEKTDETQGQDLYMMVTPRGEFLKPEKKDSDTAAAEDLVPETSLNLKPAGVRARANSR